MVRSLMDNSRISPMCIFWDVTVRKAQVWIMRLLMGECSVSVIESCYCGSLSQSWKEEERVTPVPPLPQWLSVSCSSFLVVSMYVEVDFSHHLMMKCETETNLLWDHSIKYETCATCCRFSFLSLASLVWCKVSSSRSSRPPLLSTSLLFTSCQQ